MGEGETHGVDRQFCRSLRVFPDRSGTPERLLIDAQTDLSVLSFVRYISKVDGLPVHISASDLDARLTAHFGVAGDANPTPQVTANLAESQVSDSGVVSEINDIIRSSIEQRASDIHFEPGEHKLQCRTRLDGMLVTKKQIDKDRVPEIVSRLKIMAALDIAEKRRPQDGRIRFPFDSRVVDIRVSVIPTDYGEKVVLRLLDKDTLRLDLEALGFKSDQLATFKESISLPNGIVLVTGPTGSGKTTTLYAALNFLRSPHVNISTVEDPIEYNLAGINQTQVKPEIDLTFSGMLRALLRQDPNIIMVGEIRDRETLDIAVRASLTGHLVLSTVHTNSAVATVSRLLDMGAESYLLTSSLRLIVAQRLLRLNCRHCLETSISEANQAAARKVGFSIDVTTRESSGCDRCNGTGFAGRTAVYELLSISEAVRGCIQAGGSESQLLQRAREQGFVPMLESARALVSSGLTTPLEVLRELTSQ